MARMRLQALWKNVTRRVDPHLLLLWALTVPALAPLFSPGYFFASHDGRHSVFYLTMFDASLRDGALWPRWAMHHIQGYGYPTFIIQAPLGFYTAEIFVLLGAGFVMAAKLTWILGFLVSGWGMYRLISYWLLLPEGEATSVTPYRLAAVVAGLIYVYVPYHLVTAYVRAALNDFLLLAWFPWVLLAFDQLIHLDSAPRWRTRLAVAALVLAGALLTHTFALLSFLPLLVSFVLFRLAVHWRHLRRTSSSRDRRDPEAVVLQSNAQDQRKSHKVPWRAATLAAAAGLLALLLYAAFLLPLAIEAQSLEQQVYVSDTYDYRNHFVFFGQFLSPYWGFGFSDDPTGAGDGMPFQLGLITSLLAIVAFIILIREEEAIPIRRALLAYTTIATMALVFLMLPVSAPIWDSFPLLAIIQFPWRLLSLTALTLSATAGLVLANRVQLSRIYSPPGRSEDSAGLLLFAALAIFASYGYIQAPLSPVEPWREDGRAVFRFEQEHPDMIAYTTWVQEPFVTSPMTDDYQADSYSEWHGVVTGLDRLAIVRGEGEILEQFSRGSSGGGVVRIDEAPEGTATVRIHEYYFPGWQVTVDGKAVTHRVSDPFGLIEVDVPLGLHQIEARMRGTAVRMAGALISWSALAVIAGLLLWDRRPKRRPDIVVTAKLDGTNTGTKA